VKASQIVRDMAALLSGPGKHSIVVTAECPDDGTVELYRGRCPKCGGKSWTPRKAASFADEVRRREEQRRKDSTTGGDRID
jgi:hypothetical protein